MSLSLTAEQKSLSEIFDTKQQYIIPSYQRPYSWEYDECYQLYSDLIEAFKTKQDYFIGNLVIAKSSENKAKLEVIDGQQRLTTIVIFLSALFKRLSSIRKLTETEQEIFEDIIKRNSTYRFETVDYDNQLFKDYVIDQTKKDKNGLETASAKRIVNAFDFFVSQLENKDEDYLLKMLDTVQNATCTTHLVKDELEAIQMFIFQNNRGKKPSNLEIIKAQFMFNVHLYGGEEKDKDSLIDTIKNRFEKIYKSISSIEYYINEDDVLVYTLRVHFNSLWETNAIEKINKLLSDGNPIPFIMSFTRSLAISFEHLTTFFGKDEREQLEVHSLITLGGIGIAIPFVIKAYTFDLPTDTINQLCSKLESIILRHRLIGTRAELTSRINDVYQKFTTEQPDIKPIVDRIEWMKNVSNDSWWWSYWNRSEFEKSLQGGMHHSIAKFLLWKYENYLENQGKNGYSLTRFDKIVSPELEHIAPKTPTNGEPIAAGYCEYDEEFINQYIDCLGNYLLISKSHNCSVGNKPFSEKRNSYNHLEQQREIQKMTAESEIWDKEKISLRKDKIVKFILENF